MAVRIDSGPIEAEYVLYEVPRDKWRELMLARRRFLEIKLSYDCRCLVQFVNDAEQMFDALGFASAKAMIRDGYGLRPDEIKLAVEWLELNPPNEPISLDEVKKLAKHGGDRRSERAKDQVDNINLKTKGGTSRAYILARLERDHPKLAADVRSGKLSANAAGRAAGFIKSPATPLEQMTKFADKLTDAQWTKFKRDEDRRRKKKQHRRLSAPQPKQQRRFLF